VAKARRRMVQRVAAPGSGTARLSGSPETISLYWSLCLHRSYGQCRWWGTDHIEVIILRAIGVARKAQRYGASN
jgi:hypothetical protein